MRKSMRTTLPSSTEEHVGGLDVAVHDLLLVRRPQRVEQRQAQSGHSTDRQRPVGLQRLPECPPGQQPIATQTRPSSSTMSWILITPAWSTRAAARASARARAFASVSSGSSPAGRTCLSATGCCSTSSSASQTSPMPPRPSCERSRDRPATSRPATSSAGRSSDGRSSGDVRATGIVAARSAAAEPDQLTPTDRRRGVFPGDFMHESVALLRRDAIGASADQDYRVAVIRRNVAAAQPDPPMAAVASVTRRARWQDAGARAGWVPGERWQRGQRSAWWRAAGGDRWICGVSQ